MTPKRIEWPKEYQDKGWLNTRSEHLLTEPRTTNAWHQSLLKRGISLADRVHLGGPEVPAPRTLEDCKREIQAYYDANRVRPSVTTSKGWGNWDGWLRSQDTSLSKLCDDLGLPALKNLERTMEDCKREIRAYYEANGKRPSVETSKGWGNWNKWLRSQGSALSQLCDDLGLPALNNRSRTVEDCKREIQAYYEANGKRPSVETSKEWCSVGAWLNRQGTSLRQLCDDLGLPPLYHGERTLEDCKREVRAYYDANGVRPSRGASAGWARWNSWLERQGTSLSKLCDELGLPALKNLEHTMEDCKREIQSYFKANRVRPSVKTSAEWHNWNDWLRSHQGSSVSRLCDEMGLPALKNLERTKADCEQQIQAYLDANGKRPSVTSSKEWGNWDAWLRRRQGSSFHQLCDEMRLPKAKAA